MSFEIAFQKTVGVEGGYSNDASDRGGETMYGITERVARANGYQGPMSKMPLSEAQRIYRTQYWDTMKLSDIDNASPGIAEELFDTGVNMGIGVAGSFLQRVLNVMNRGGSDYPDMVVDGIVGPVTIQDLKIFLSKRGKVGEGVILSALNSLQGAKYIDIAEKNPTQERFEFGWFFNRVST